MNNNEQKKSVEKSISKAEKRNWVSPEINQWESVNIGLNYGGVVDGGSKSYNT